MAAVEQETYGNKLAPYVVYKIVSWQKCEGMFAVNIGSKRYQFKTAEVTSDLDEKPPCFLVG